MNPREFAKYLLEPGRQADLAVEYNSYGIPVRQHALCINRDGSLFINTQENAEATLGEDQGVLFIPLPEGVDVESLASFVNSDQFLVVLSDILSKWNGEGFTPEVEQLVGWVNDAVSKMNYPFHVWADMNDWWDTLKGMFYTISQGKTTIEKKVASIGGGEDILIEYSEGTVVYTRRSDIRAWLQNMLEWYQLSGAPQPPTS